jgi:hypothetical protein
MRCRKSNVPPPAEEVVALLVRVATLEAALRVAQASARKAFELAAWGGRREAQQGQQPRYD